MITSLPPLYERDGIFISHANPEDNAFATWLTLRLAREGYRVWCDVVKLFGGDDFWRDIENAIREQARKFIFVTSRASNEKPGTLNELSVAAGVGRELGDTGFIIPVKIDDLPFSDHNIQINRLIAIPFTNAWADGLASLLKALEEDSVPKPNAGGAVSVASWWNANRLNSQILIQRRETLWTNWFALKEMPKKLYAWQVPRGATLQSAFAFPTYRHGDWLFSFADGEALTGKRDDSPTGGRLFTVHGYLKREPPVRSQLERHEVITAVKLLLRLGWESFALSRNLRVYELSCSRKALWFANGVVPGNTVNFIGVGWKKCRRDVCGYSTRTKANGEKYKRYWHLGLEATTILYPSPAVGLKCHVVFTSDGKTASGDPKAQHRARRSQCKGWWNDKWRDLMLSAVAWLAEGARAVRLPLAPCGPLMLASPLKFNAEVGYSDADVRLPPPEILTESDDEEEGDEPAEGEATETEPEPTES